MLRKPGQAPAFDLYSPLPYLIFFSYSIGLLVIYFWWKSPAQNWAQNKSPNSLTHQKVPSWFSWDFWNGTALTYLNSILLSRHFVNTFSTYWIWPSSNFLQQRKKRTITTNLLGTRGGVNTVTRRVDLLSSAFHLFFLFGWQVFGPLTAREESLNGKKDTWVTFIMFCLFPYVTLLLAMAF